ncbi:hypothetical protein ACLOJK_018616 [Asimina triloba]
MEESPWIIGCFGSLAYDISHITRSNEYMFPIRLYSCNLRFCLAKDAMVKDTLERATEPNLNLRAYLQDAYVHPVFKDDDGNFPAAVDEEEYNPLVPTKRPSQKSTPNLGSEVDSEYDASGQPFHLSQLL